MECFKGWTASETIINPVPGVSTEGGAVDWASIWGGVNNIYKILGVVSKRDFSPRCFNKGRSRRLGAKGWGQ